MRASSSVIINASVRQHSHPGTHHQTSFFKPPLPSFSRRKLHRFKDHRPRVIIGNNAALFATLHSFEHFDRNTFGDVKIIYPDFWLDTVHSTNYRLDWGQNALSLPVIARKIFKQLYPNHSEDSFVTWGEYQDIRQHAIKRLFTEYGVDLVRGLPRITATDAGYQINVGDRLNISMPKNTYFYNWFRVPKDHQLSADIPRKSHLELYRKDPVEVPSRIVVFGRGLSVVWLAKHFPQCEIASIARAADKLPLIPANQDVDLNRIKLFNYDDINVYLVDKTAGEVAISKNNDDYASFSGHIYTAIGLENRPEVTHCIPSSHKLVVPYSDESWVAPKNIPKASLIESYLKWMHLTENYDWAFELQMYHATPYPEIIKNKMLKFGVVLNSTFFDALEKKIFSLRNPMNKKAEFDLFCDVFKETMSPPSNVEKRFKQALAAIQHEKEEMLKEAIHPQHETNLPTSSLKP